MAAVYQGFEPSLGREVAVKILPTEFLRDETFANRFLQEARVVASLEHPNIVPIYASGIDRGRPWMSMRLLNGGSLADVIDKGRLDREQILNILRDVASAVDFAHAKGVIHRDVKPSNVLLDEAGRAYVCDFGLARLMVGSDGWTQTGTVVGTPHYMAPEQALNTPIGSRYDVYSIGIVAYEMFTGTKPFTGDSPLGVLMQHANTPVPPPAPDVLSDDDFAVLLKALAKNPKDRWPTAGAFVSALEGTAASSRTLTLSGIAAAVLGVVVVLGAISLWPERPGTPVEQPPPNATDPTLNVLPAGPAPATVVTPPDRMTPVKTGEAIERMAAPARSEAGGTPSQLSPSDGAAAKPAPEAATPADGGSAEPQRNADSRATTEVGVERNAIVNPPIVEQVDNPTATREVITAPVRRRAVNPVYPQIARAGQIQGNVLLEATIDLQGRVSGVQVLRSVHPILDDAAIAAVRQFEYSPGLRNGTPIVSKIQVPISFRLSQ